MHVVTNASVEHFSVFHITLVKSSSNLWTQRNICYLKSQELIQSTIPAVMADADALWLCHDDTDEKKREGKKEESGYAHYINPSVSNTKCKLNFSLFTGKRQMILLKGA